METIVRQMHATLIEMNNRLEDLTYQVSKGNELIQKYGLSTDLLRQSTIDHQAFIDDKLGVFGERFCAEREKHNENGCTEEANQIG